MACFKSASEGNGRRTLSLPTLIHLRLKAFVASLFLLSGAEALAQSGTAVVPSAENGLATGTRQTITLTATARSYTVGAAKVDESVAPFSWHLTSPHLELRVSGSPMRLNARPTTVSAWSPLQMRANIALRAGDTISVYGRTSSSPVSLDTAQIRAVGAVSTSVLDLTSQGLGVPAQIGTRVLVSFPVGDFVIGASGALEQDARPQGLGATYWLGTTVRGALSFNAVLGEGKLALGADVSHSTADSLGGRNQFPGGGAVDLTAEYSGPLGEDGKFWFSGDGFYTRPFGNARSDQPTRLIPTGDLIGLTGSVTLETGSVVWSPTVTVLRESSRANVTVQQGLQRLQSSLTAGAWSVAGGLSVDIPFGKSLTLSPEIGAVSGSVSSTYTQTAGRGVIRRGRGVGGSSASRTQDGISGVWGGIGVSARF